MSWSVSIFINRASSLERLAEDLRPLLGLVLERSQDEFGLKYTSIADDFEVVLCRDHGLINDSDIKFEEYEYQFTFWRRNVRNPEEAQYKILRLAWLTFDKLKESGGYAAMLVENAQKKLASFWP